MKITDQNIPSELSVAYAKLISRKPTAAGISFSAHTKPRVLKKAPTRKPRKIMTDYENAVDFLIAYLTKKNNSPPPSTFRAEQISALKNGIFSTEYWSKCTEDSSATLENAPSSGAFVGTRNYAYPDPNNQPSTPTYGAGVPSTGDSAYTGWTTAGTFSDTGLRWIRKVFSLRNKFSRNEKEPLFLKLSGTITATANQRPSRAMLSAILKRWIVTETSTRLTTTDAPVIKPISALYRYKTLRGVAPYFSLIKPLQLMYSVRSPAYEESGDQLTKAVVLIAPMPMMGKRYNNNTSVTTTLAATLELWQIKKGNPGFWANNWLLHDDGSFDAISPPNFNWFVFFDDTHGLMEATNATTGLREYFFLDGKLSKTPYSAPWQALPLWNTEWSVMNWYQSATGYLIAVQNNVSGDSNFYYLNADGTIASQGNGINNPDMWSIIWQNQGMICYAPWLNAYIMDQFPLNGNQLLDIYSTAGVMTSQYYYHADGIWNQGQTFASDTAAYAITSSVSSGVRTVQLWRMTDQPLTLVATFTIGNSQWPGVAYNAGVFYFFGNNSTSSSKSCTETGTVAAIGNVGFRAPLGAVPANLPRITG